MGESSLESLEKDGFTRIVFDDFGAIRAMQDIVRRFAPGLPDAWPTAETGDEERIACLKQIALALGGSGLLAELIRRHSSFFTRLLGPDIDVQAIPHVRVSRPNRQSDLVHWHRDFFYGNTPWEMNLWFPLFPLGEGSGLQILPGSHLEPARNVREFEESDAFRRSVEKGSDANFVGYVYAPKIDDTIARMDPAAPHLLTPFLGEAILFFGHAVHRGVNRSSQTRVSVDIRIRPLRAPTRTKPGYYVPVLRGPIERCARRFLSPSLSLLVPCLNEARNLESTVTTLVSALDGVISDYEIVILNDGSTDGTGDIADRLAATVPGVRAIHHERNRGLGGCFYAGIELATKEHVMMIFGDNEIDPTSLRGLFEKVGEADIIIPFLTNMHIRPWHRRLLSWFFTGIVNGISGRRLRYYNGPVIHRRANLLGLSTRTGGFAYMAEILTLLLGKGHSYLEVPYWMQTRPHGSPKAFRWKNLVSVTVTLAQMLRRRLAGGAA